MTSDGTAYARFRRALATGNEALDALPHHAEEAMDRLQRLCWPTGGVRRAGDSVPPMHYETILYRTDGPVATITLNRPKSLNTIVPPMPDEVQDAVAVATRDPGVKVIVVRGAGRAFCAGYDFSGGFHHWDAGITTDGRWDPGKDFAAATDPQLAQAERARNPRLVPRLLDRIDS